MSSRILVVEDDPSIRLGLKRSLEFEGFAVELARDGEEAIQRAFDKKPDLIVLDIMLPRVNGFEVCRTVRKYDAALGLELGADDYITKPFSIRELTARIKRHLTRRRQAEGEVDKFEEEGLEIDFAGQTMSVHAEARELSTREFKLLQFLIQNRGRVLSRDQILNKVWGYDYDGTPRTIDNFINKLRQKLGDDPTSPRWIQTVRGSGYKFKSPGA